MKTKILLFLSIFIGTLAFSQGSQTNTPLPNASSEIKALSSGKSANVKVNSSTTVNNATTTVSESGKSATEVISTTSTTAKIIETATVGTTSAKSTLSANGTVGSASIEATNDSGNKLGQILVSGAGVVGINADNGTGLKYSQSAFGSDSIQLRSFDDDGGDQSIFKLKPISLQYIIQSGSSPEKATHFVDWTKSETKIEDSDGNEGVFNINRWYVVGSATLNDVLGVTRYDSFGVDVNGVSSQGFTGIRSEQNNNIASLMVEPYTLYFDATDGTNTSTTTVTPTECVLNVEAGGNIVNQSLMPSEYTLYTTNGTVNSSFAVSGGGVSFSTNESTNQSNISLTPTTSTETITGASSQVTTVTKTASSNTSKVENTLADVTVLQDASKWQSTATFGAEQSQLDQQSYVFSSTVSDATNVNSISQTSTDLDFSAVRVTFDAKVKGLSDQNSVSAGTYTVNVTNETVYVVFTGTTSTMTFPSVTGNTGTVVTFINKGSGDITTATPGAANIIWVAGSATNTTTIANGTISSYYCDGTNWISL